jgi:hypothetical protein
MTVSGAYSNRLAEFKMSWNLEVRRNANSLLIGLAFLIFLVLEFKLLNLELEGTNKNVALLVSAMSALE